MKEKIKLAFLMHGIYYGGATRSLQLLLETIDRNQFEIFLFTIHSKAKEIATKLEKKVDLLKIVNVKTISNNQVAVDSKEKIISILEADENDFVSIIKKYDIDILHINSSVFAHIPLLLKKYTKVRIVFHVREIIGDFHNGEIQKLLINRIYNYSDIIICISNNEEKVFEKKDKIHVLPNPFNFNEILNLKPILRKKYKLNKNDVLIGMTSHFSKMKGHMLFLNEMINVLSKIQNRKNLKFIIIGVKKNYKFRAYIKKLFLINSYEYEILKFIKKNKLKNNIIIIPYVENIFSYLIDIDIYVRPSLANDPWGRDIIEAMALKKPIVATGTSEFFIKNGVTGYLIPPENYHKMAEKIIYLIKNSEERERIGENGFKMIRKMCDIIEYGNKIKNIYNDLI